MSPRGTGGDASGIPASWALGLRAAGRRPALLGSHVRRVRSAPSARSPIPDPRAAAPRTLGGGAAVRAGGPDGGAGRRPRSGSSRNAGPSALPALFKESPDVSRAGPPSPRPARGPGQTLGPPLYPSQGHTTPGPPHVGSSLRSPGQLGVVRGRCRGICSSGRLDTPATRASRHPGVRDCANIQTQTETRAPTQAPCTDNRSHHTDARTHAQTQVHAYLSGIHPQTPHGEGREKSNLGAETPTGTLPLPPTPVSPKGHPEPGIGHRAVCARRRRTGTHALDGMGGGAERE